MRASLAAALAIACLAALAHAFNQTGQLQIKLLFKLAGDSINVTPCIEVGGYACCAQRPQPCCSCIVEINCTHARAPNVTRVALNITVGGVEYKCNVSYGVLAAAFTCRANLDASVNGTRCGTQNVLCELEPSALSGRAAFVPLLTHFEVRVDLDSPGGRPLVRHVPLFGRVDAPEALQLPGSARVTNLAIGVPPAATALLILEWATLAGAAAALARRAMRALRGRVRYVDVATI